MRLLGLPYLIRNTKQEYIPNMIFSYEGSLVEQEIQGQNFLGNTLNSDTDLLGDVGNLPGHCDFIFSSVKLAELLPTSQILKD